MKILYAVSEARPFTASGGLSDVAGSLPKALKARRQACRIVTPLYESVNKEMKAKMKFIGNFMVKLSWRKQYCGIFEVNEGGVIYYFIDNEYYFKRPNLYGYHDDCERFAFFSMAILEMLTYINFTPDIIHCNDWQTALVPVYLELFYKKRDEYKNIKTVFTIHNIQYQGIFGYDIIEDVLGIPNNAVGMLEYDSNVNLMKAALDNADKITTVSPTYANELEDPWYAHGLDNLILQHSEKMIGILNGIDYKMYNPENDSDIYASFSAQKLQGKTENKIKLLSELGIDSINRPLLGIVSRFVSHKGFDLIRFVFDEMVQAGFNVAILGSGDSEYEEFLEEMQNRYSGRVSVTIDFIPALAKKIYAGSDMFLMPSRSEPCGLAQMISLRYGTVPIVRETGGLKDSIKDCSFGNGNGFIFSEYNASEMMSAIYRALELYNKKDLWEKLVKYCLHQDFRWTKSAAEYIKIYQQLIEEYSLSIPCKSE